MVHTNIQPSLRFVLCLLVIICARSAAEDNSNLLSRLYELLSKNRQPVLLVLDHAGLKSSNRENNNAYNSLEEKNALSSFLSGLNQNTALSAKRPLLPRESNKYHGLYQDDQDRNSKDKTYRDNDDNQLDKVNDVKNRYQLNRERSLLNSDNGRQGRYRSHQDRNRNLKTRNRNTRGENRNRLNRHREQLDRDRDLQDRYDDGLQMENLDQLNKYTNLLFQQNRNLQHKNRDDESRLNLDRNSRYDRQRYYDRRERKRGLRSQSPVIRSLLRISNSLRCEARDECQNECDEESKNSCENECEEKFECDDKEEETGSTKGVPLEETDNKCKRC